MTNATANKWSDYRPTKTVWLWSCIGVAAATMIIGFTAGGWVTGGTATERADAATEQAVAQLAAGICANRFLAANDAQAQLAALQETDSWRRDSFIEKGGWVTFTSMESPPSGAAELCAEQLIANQAPKVDPGT